MVLTLLPLWYLQTEQLYWILDPSLSLILKHPPGFKSLFTLSLESSLSVYAILHLASSLHWKPSDLLVPPCDLVPSPAVPSKFQLALSDALFPAVQFPSLTSFTSGVSLDPTLSFEPSRPLVQSVLMGSLPRNFGVYLFQQSQTKFNSSLGVLPLDNYSLAIPPMDCSQLECPPWLHLCTQFH